ncbi:uncharacterized protein B0H64DRAFT_136403 [Chaetomium fimeti]|uniref:Uncharacterized protein n=1 Tax=Chaetomium fimeti TaxID=1854472 RepID=A0AAE0HKT4_9PEZI|nr:hypothetical protein B0H64DRAFT_136403 [Chaetomium fimeti]
MEGGKNRPRARVRLEQTPAGPVSQASVCAREGGVVVTEPKAGCAETDWTGTDFLAAPGLHQGGRDGFMDLPAARAARHGPQIGGRSTERGRMLTTKARTRHARVPGDKNSRSNLLQGPGMFRRLCASLKLLQDPLASQTKACGPKPHLLPQPMGWQRDTSRFPCRHPQLQLSVAFLTASPRSRRSSHAGPPSASASLSLIALPAPPPFFFHFSLLSPHSRPPQASLHLPYSFEFTTGVAHHLTPIPSAYTTRRRRPFSLRAKS